MARGRAAKNDADSDDGASVDSASTGFSSVGTSAAAEQNGSVVTFTDAAATLHEHIENLGEKKGAVRKAALEGVRSVLSSVFSFDALEGHSQTLFSSAAALMRKGDVDEAKMAARCIGLLIVTLGVDAHDNYEDYKTTLMTIVSSRKHGPVAAACFDLISLMCFMTNQDQPDVLIFMDECFSRLSANGMTQADIKSALSSWGLLLTMLPLRFISANLGKWLPTLMLQLENADLDVRTAAGECIALMFEAHYFYADEANPDDVPALPECREELAGKVHELVSVSAKSTSKSDKLKQRSIFRDVEETLDNEHDVSEKIKLRGETIDLEGWAELKQMSCLRSALQEGLQLHLTTNPFVRSVFGLGDVLTAADHAKKATSDERKSMMAQAAAQSKTRHLKIQKHRKERHQRNGAFAGEDD